MSDENTKPESKSAPFTPRKDRRPSRYVMAQQRRNAAKARDNRFYMAIFSLMSVVVLVALSISALMVNGAALDTSGMAGWAAPWLLGFSKLELAGLGLVGLVAFVMWRKMQK